MSSAIEKRQPAVIAAPVFTTEQERMIRDSFLSGASPQESAVLLELSRARRLNPITKQIHFVKRWDSQKRCEVWAAQVGIDGFRAIAERTGLYDGQDEAEFEYDAKGALKLARVRVYRKDWSRPSVGVAHFSEYVQLTKEKAPTHMWATKPHIMLAKCAEALAFRKAFPEDTSGLEAPEEIGSEHEVTTAPKLDSTKAKLAAAVAAKSEPKQEAIEDAVVVEPTKPAEVVTFEKPAPLKGKAVFDAIIVAAVESGIEEAGAKEWMKGRGLTKLSQLVEADLAAFGEWVASTVNAEPPADEEVPF